MHWRHSGSPCETKFKQILSMRKVMCTVFWDRRSILLVHFLTRGETVNAESYCETLQKLRWPIQNKRRGMLTAGVVLLHDNSRPHTARLSTHLLQEFSWEVFIHVPYSPGLAPSDFLLFLRLKKFQSGQRFQNDMEAEMSVTHGSNPRRQTSTTQEYKSWSRGMANFSIPEKKYSKIALEKFLNTCCICYNASLH